MTCGVGLRQVAPFRMKREPKWGNRHILQLNWVFDEYFVLPDVWESVFKPFGVGRRPVLDHRREKPLSTVVQLDIQGRAMSKIDFKDDDFEVCESCGYRKHHAHRRGMFPFVETDRKDHMVKTQEYFGSGGSAWQAILISAELYREIKRKKLKGVTFYPMAEA